MGLDSTVKTGAKTIKQAFKNATQNFIDSTVANSRKVVPKMLSSKLKNLGKNAMKEFSSSILYNAGTEYFEFVVTGCFR